MGDTSHRSAGAGEPVQFDEYLPVLDADDAAGTDFASNVHSASYKARPLADFSMRPLLSSTRCARLPAPGAAGTPR